MVSRRRGAQVLGPPGAAHEAHELAPAPLPLPGGGACWLGLRDGSVVDPFNPGSIVRELGEVDARYSQFGAVSPFRDFGLGVGV